ncbi:hypothetical protein N5D48_15065 [Pseudomonas sp. GD03858]|uniref:hypothetical protein n=1 Tax=unclassified Pseudomonas TaxID=196821 RepID=UPI002449CF68|nr:MULTISPECIES: hypothetical protein [unclassified Pseudomonas]MDH0647844.1 hypothetical protein [Pseudomonas sp. GD03867]MDH0663730.1 hypothetical protein [Pseudomonas sp. GD03858]
MATVQIMSVVGSAVPRELRLQGLLACWYLMRNGETISGPLTSRASAQHMAEHLSVYARLI